MTESQDQFESSTPRPEPVGQGLISERVARQKQSERLVLLVVRLLFLVMLATVTTLTIGAQAEKPEEFSYTTVISILVSTMAVGVIVLAVDYLTPNKRLASVVGVYLGICVGLLGAIAIARLIDVVAQAWKIESNPNLDLAKVVVGIVLCYLAVSFVLTTKDDFRLVIPYVEFAKQVRGIRPLLLDTSVLIDGRIDGMVASGFMDAPLVIPMFVVEELQTLSDSNDRLKRTRGRRGLDMVERLQANGEIDVSVEEFDVPGHSVDHKLVDLARMHQMRIMTTDFNLVKVAKINGVTALNVNDLASGIKTGVLPGEHLEVEIVKQGENEGQGVGFMPDGTMIVVEDAARLIGSSITAVVTNSLQTSAGRMIFAKIEGTPNGADEPAERAARTATNQPRHTSSPQQSEGRPRGDSSRRNPRRS